MGCNSSREAAAGNHDGDVSPPARSINRNNITGSGRNSGAAAAAVAAARDGDPSSSSQAMVEHPGAPSLAADGRPNKPLHPPSPVAKCPATLTFKPWTPSELQRQRDAFFDTRVTGSAEVWAALRLVCDMLREGDLTGAQSMMDATGLTCPTGRIASERQTGRSGRTGKKGGVYDNTGVMYDVPGWIVADPQDLVQDEKQEHDEEKNEKSHLLLDKLDGGNSSIISEQEREEEMGSVVNVRARLSGREIDVVVSVGTEQRVGVLVAKIKEKAGVKGLRLAHLGKMLGENEKVCETGWTPGQVLNAFVFE